MGLQWSWLHVHRPCHGEASASHPSPVVDSVVVHRNYFLSSFIPWKIKYDDKKDLILFITFLLKEYFSKYKSIFGHSKTKLLFAFLSKGHTLDTTLVLGENQIAVIKFK